MKTLPLEHFLKIKDFKLKVEKFEFKDVKYMPSTQKAKIYKSFVSFLNSHFKPTCFKKDIYEHCHLHCGFIAHYNINGFYGEYFETAAIFHKIAQGIEKKPTEYDGFYVGGLEYEGKESLSSKMAFFQIYEEFSNKKGIGEFYNTMTNQRGYGDYDDLNKAINDAFDNYLETWRYEISLAIKAYDKFNAEEKVLKEHESKISTSQTRKSPKQLSLFDF